ncbi:MAG: phosphatase PAP2 family protein [Desulfopila sp.]|jgi:membrane-associated phospholipid phosphatase|nr:phosphatase PAP2 family protein [Desulfopila sp.]
MSKKRLRARLWEHPHFEVLCIPPLLLTHRLCYDLVGVLQSGREVNYADALITPLDLHIPYIPIFILPYVLTWAYAFFIAAYAILLKTYDQQTFRYFYLSFLMLTGLECVLWYSFPASIMIRVPPHVLADSGWLGALTAYVYERATPWNVIPSAHIAFAYIAWLFSSHFAPPGGNRLFFLLFVLVCLSVLFVKNHYIVDIAGGVALGHLVYHLVFLPALRRNVLGDLSPTALVGICYTLVAFVVLCYGGVMGWL